MSTPQLSFDAMLDEAATDNRRRGLLQASAHLPGSFNEAIPYFEALLMRHHQAMLDVDVDRTMALRREARLLAEKLNGGHFGICAPDGAGVRLSAATRATDPTPLWGQEGELVIEAVGVPMRIIFETVFGIGSSTGFWLGFAAHAVDHRRPFISETGFRSFLGASAEICAGVTPAVFAQRIIGSFADRELRGRLIAMTSR